MSDVNNPPPFVNDFERGLKPVVARWTIPGWLYSTHANQAILANRIYYQPIFIPERTPYDRIGVYVGAGDGVGGLCRLGLYNWDGGLPTSLILDAGTVSTNLAGAQEIVIAETLERGYYFLAYRGDQTPSLSGPNTAGAIKSPVSGQQSTNNQASMAVCVLSAAAAFTDPATVPDATHYVGHVAVRLREA